MSCGGSYWMKNITLWFCSRSNPTANHKKRNLQFIPFRNSSFFILSFFRFFSHPALKNPDERKLNSGAKNDWKRPRYPVPRLRAFYGFSKTAVVRRIFSAKVAGSLHPLRRFPNHRFRPVWPNQQLCLSVPVSVPLRLSSLP